MSSLRNTTVGSDDALLDAARDCLLAVGWKRTTLTEVARRAGVSRMTMYRRWPDMRTLMADLMTREWSAIGARAQMLVGEDRTTAAGISQAVAEGAVALRANPLFCKVVDVDPDLLLPYLIERRGRTQDALLDLIETAVAEGQATGMVRQAPPRAMGRSVVLAVHGFAISAGTMTDGVSADALADELRLMLERYLRP